MKKQTFAALSVLALTAAAHAATQPDTSLRDGQAIASVAHAGEGLKTFRLFCGENKVEGKTVVELQLPYPDLSKAAEVQNVSAKIAQLQKAAGRPIFIETVAKNRDDRDALNEAITDAIGNGKLGDNSVVPNIGYSRVDASVKTLQLCGVATDSPAATQSETSLRDGQALAEFFTSYPDLSKQDQSETARALIQSLVAHVGPDAYIRIDARSQRDADTFNAWLKETGFKGRMFNGSVSGALANGDAMRDLRIFVAAGKGMEQPYSVTVPASFVRETYEANMPMVAPLDRGRVIVRYALPYPVRMDIAALGKVRLMVDGFRDQLGDSVDIMAHTRSDADAKAVEQVFSDAKLPEGNPAYGGYAVAEPKLVNLQFRVTGSVVEAH